MIASSASARARQLRRAPRVVLADRAEGALDVADVRGVEHGALARRRRCRAGALRLSLPSASTSFRTPRNAVARRPAGGLRPGISPDERRGEDAEPTAAARPRTSRQFASGVAWVIHWPGSVRSARASMALAPCMASRYAGAARRGGASPRGAAARARRRRRSRRSGVPSVSITGHRDQVVVGHQQRDLGQIGLGATVGGRAPPLEQAGELGAGVSADQLGAA